jgi:hypothetical protein
METIHRIMDSTSSESEAHHVAYGESNRVYAEQIATMSKEVWNQLKIIYKMIPNSPPCPTIDRCPTDTTNQLKKVGVNTVVKEGWNLVKNKPVVRGVAGVGKAVGGVSQAITGAIGSLLQKSPSAPKRTALSTRRTPSATRRSPSSTRRSPSVPKRTASSVESYPLRNTEPSWIHPNLRNANVKMNQKQARRARAQTRAQ